MTGDPGWCHYNSAARRLTLTLHVQPGARRSQVVGIHGDALKVRVAAPAADNKANAALVEFLSETLGVQRLAITIRRGATGRRKIVEISGDPTIGTRLAAFAADQTHR